MNFLALKNKWQVDKNTFELSGDVANELIETHELVKGIELNGLIVDECQVKFEVLECSKSYLKIEILERKEVKREASIILLSAISRPQTMKKVLELSGTFEISEVHFFKSNNSQKSYLTSKALNEDAMQKMLLKGMQQSGNVFLPKTFICKSFRDFKEKLFNSKEIHSDYLKIIASPLAKDNIGIKHYGAKDVVLAIGPESGFTDSELNFFIEHGFLEYNLGKKILRVETALVSILSKFK